MDLVRLPVGKQAAIDVDCIRIEERDDHRFRLTGSVLCKDVEEAESVSIVDGPTFATAADAEAAGIAWATDAGVDTLYVSSGTRTHPLEPLEIDRPL